MARDSEQVPIAFAHICRGEGKIYTLVETTPELRECEFTSLAESSSGTPLPSILRRWRDDDSRILILPITETGQHCTVSAITQEGAVVASADLSLSPLSARMHSVANTLRKDDVVAQIRNYDSNRAGQHIQIGLLRSVTTSDGDSIVHVQVDIIGAGNRELNDGIDMRFLDGSGRSLIEGQPVVLRDSIVSDEDRFELPHRVLVYSVRISLKSHLLIAWATLRRTADACEFGCEDTIQGFRVFDSGDLDRIRWAWEDYTRNVGRTGGYDHWFRTVHMVREPELAAQSRFRFPVEPLFSIIVPLYHTPIDLFTEAVDSVLAQSYGKFQLVLVNSTPQDGELATVVKDYLQRDSRITCVELAENRGIAENTNAGIKAATGDFVCFLDHDDLLEPDALFCYVKGINNYPETDLLYSDEDVLREGRYESVFFKPDWNPDLLESVNYVCHFLCVRRSIIDEVGMSSSEFDGSQDHDLTFRVTEKARNIYHARRVLYHWRSVPGSTADSLDSKPYAFENGIKAIQAHVERMGRKAIVHANPRVPFGLGYEVLYQIESEPLVSILIPSKDSIDELSRCIDSIFAKSTYRNFEVIIIENNSVDPETFAYYERIQTEHNQIRVCVYEHPFNYSAANNLGAQYAQGEYLLMLNNDTEVLTEDWIERMLSLCMREDTGIVGVKLVYPDYTIQHAGIIGLKDGPTALFRYCAAESCEYANLLQARSEKSAVTGACMMIRRSVFDEVGGFDERFAIDYNDVALCLSVRDAGYLVVYEPGVELIHSESISRNLDKTVAEQIQFAREYAYLFEKWPEYRALPDPCGNPNFIQEGNAYFCGPF